jgi:hypothetical protein
MKQKFGVIIPTIWVNDKNNTKKKHTKSTKTYIKICICFNNLYGFVLNIRACSAVCFLYF